MDPRFFRKFHQKFETCLTKATEWEAVSLRFFRETQVVWRLYAMIWRQFYREDGSFSVYEGEYQVTYCC